MPVGRCVTRTAESVVLTHWPPGPLERYLDAGEGRLAPLLGVGGRDADEPVDAGLGAQHSEGVLALDGERGAVDADDLRRGAVVHRDLPPPAGAVAHVHLEQHEGPVLSLQAALPGLDGDDGVPVVELAGEPARELHLVDGAREGLDRGGRLGEQLLVTVHLRGELERGPGVAQALAGALDRGDVVAVAGELGHDGPGRVGVVPEAGGGDAVLELRHALALLVEVQVGFDLGQPEGERVERLRGHGGELGHHRFLPWQFLNFLPLPQGHGSLRPTLA